MVARRTRQSSQAAPEPHPDSRDCGATPGHVGLWRRLGCAVLDVFLIDPSHATSTGRKTSRGATPAGHRPGAALHATRQAAGASSAWSQLSNDPPRDRADGATLGRPRHQPRRTRRPAPRDATPRGSSPACLNAPPPRGHATPPVARLKVGPAPPYGRRDARPHTVDRTAGSPRRRKREFSRR